MKFSILFFIIFFVVIVSASDATPFFKSKGFFNAQNFPNPFEDAFLSDDGFHSLHRSLPAFSLDRFWQLLSAFPPSSRDNSAQIPIPNSYYDFIPGQIGSIHASPLKWSSPCFKDLSATLTFNDTYGLVSIMASGKANDLCSELYSFCDRESCHFKVLEVPGHHTVQFELRDYEFYDLSRNGLGTYLWPLGVEGTTESLRKTISLFGGDNMVQNNVEFFAQKELWAMNPRPFNFLNLSVSEFHSGDMLVVLRLDGVDPLIAWGTGGTTGHTAIFVDFPDGPYVCESTDAPNPNKPYWPPPYGIIRTPFDQWMVQAIAADYHVSLIPLKPELRQQLDVSAMIQFFEETQGMPYGWHNFIFTFIDTEWNNLPRPITPDLFEVVMGVAERFIPITTKGSVYNFLIQGLNHRLNSNCTTLQCIYEIIDPMNKSLAAITAIPEQDSWRYEGNLSMVCDVFVLSMLKAGGIIDKNIQATEQTPKDLYQMNLWDVQYVRPQVCMQADPALPWCQLMGKYTLNLPGFNERALYDNMNEHCGCIPPQYYRGPFGC